jgi:hypothetical protein
VNGVSTAFRQVAHLFVEDGSLALAILGVVIVTALFALGLPDRPLVAGAILILGCLGALIANVASAARAARGA